MQASRRKLIRLERNSSGKEKYPETANNREFAKPFTKTYLEISDE
jgi:hypothetical protein